MSHASPRGMVSSVRHGSSLATGLLYRTFSYRTHRLKGRKLSIPPISYQLKPVITTLKSRDVEELPSQRALLDKGLDAETLIDRAVKNHQALTSDAWEQALAEMQVQKIPLADSA